MTARRPARKRIMREFMIKELSAVDNPAQEHAQAVLLKRADDETDPHEGDTPMTDLEKKQIADLEKSIADLTAKLEAATAKEPAKKAAELQGELEKAQATLTELTEKLAKSAADLAKVEAEKAEALAKAGMSDEEKEYCERLDKDGKSSFMGLTPEERKKRMKKSTDENPVVYKSESTGEEYRKNDDPRLVKLAKQADENEKLAKSEMEKRETAELAKRADEEPYKAFAVEKAKDGKDEIAKVDVLRAISKMDDGPRAVLEKWLEIGGKAIGAAFEKLGHFKDTVQKTSGDFNKRVTEIMARDNIDKVQALEKAQAEYPQEYAALQETGASFN